MITKHDLEYVGYDSINDYFEQIAQHIEHNELSIAKEMKSKLSRKQLQQFEMFIDEAYHYEKLENL